MSDTTTTAGAIHEIGYQRYDGYRVGRGGIVRALYWESVRSAFGWGRGTRAKILPTLVVAVLCLPAAVNVFLMAETGAQLMTYDTYLYRLQLPLMVFVATQAPELVSRDLRYRTLPLYFSRPLQRLDYPLAKYAAMVSALLGITLLPMLVLYLGSIASVHGGNAVWHQTSALAPGLLMAVVHALLLGALALAIASRTGRRVFATGGIAVLYLAAHTISTVLIHVTGLDAAGFTSLTPTLGSRLVGLISPLNLIEGFRIWATHASDGRIPPPGSIGYLYGLVLLALLAVCLLALFRRYHKVGVE